MADEIPSRAAFSFADLRSYRGLIVSTFEKVCIAFVLIPTALAILVGLVGLFGERPFAGILIAILTFVVTAFFAGGALTLVSIADNTREVVRILRQIQKGELRGIADDVRRMEQAGQDARNLKAVGAAISSGDNEHTAT